MAKIKKNGTRNKQKRGTILFRYTPDQLKNALEAIRSGMPTLSASKQFGVPRSTLRYKIDGSRPETTGRVGPKCILGEELEQTLCNWMKISCERGFPVTKDGLCYSVQKILNETNKTTVFTHNRPGRKWFDSFLARHPELTVKHAEYISKARAAVTPEQIRKWFENTLQDLGDDADILLHPERIWNMDETSFYLNPSGGWVIAEKGKHAYATSGNSDKDNVTTLVTVNAIGEFAPPLTVYKFERIPASYYTSAPPQWGIGKTKNGWMTAESFYGYFFNVFHPFLVSKGYALPVIVFLDGHSSHLSLHLSKFCRENGIIIVCLFPNTTHILQPLDVAVFFPLKCYWKKTVRAWRFEHDGKEIQKKDLPNILSEIITKASFKSAIQNGFRKCGLYPFEPNNVDYTKCVAKISTPDIDSNAVNPDIQIDMLNFRDEFLIYLESKIDNTVLEEFEEKYQRGEKTDIEQATMLFDVWSRFKNDMKEGDSQMPPALSDVMEFEFPEFQHITAENYVLENENEEVLTNDLDTIAGNSFKEQHFCREGEVEKMKNRKRFKISKEIDLNEIEENRKCQVSAQEVSAQGREFIIKKSDDEIPKHSKITGESHDNSTEENTHEKGDCKNILKISDKTSNVNIISNILILPPSPNKNQKNKRICFECFNK